MKRFLFSIFVFSFVASAEPVDAVLILRKPLSTKLKLPFSSITDTITAALTGSCFNIIDPNDAFGIIPNLNPHEESLPSSSAVRLTENLGAKVLITASIGEPSVIDIGSPPVARQVEMTLTLSAKKIPEGASFASATVTERTPNMTVNELAGKTDSIYSRLLGKLVDKASSQFLEKAASALPQFESGPRITVFFGCNVLGADVVIDGLSHGTCPGEFSVTPGVHAVRVSYPPYYNAFEKHVSLTGNGQTFAIVLQINPEGERQRAGALDYERKHAELELWKRNAELEIDAKNIDVGKKKRDLDFEFARKSKELECELAEGSELFKKQLEFADIMMERYSLSGEADDYVRKTIADGTAVYWRNSYGRIAITDGESGNIDFATPSTDAADLAIPPTPKEIGDSLQKLLMKRTGH